MSAVDHLNAAQTGPLQLPMFMRAQDIEGSLTATADSSFDDPEDVMAEKLVQSKRLAGRGAGVHRDVERHGVLSPVQLIHAEHGELMMGQGHHRVAAAAEISRRTGRDMWVPVEHTDARETSDLPLSRYSPMNEKRAVINKHRQWEEYTSALGQDISWQEQRPFVKTKKKPTLSSGPMGGSKV